MSIEDAIMGGIVFKGDVYSWTAWFRSCEDESGY